MPYTTPPTFAESFSKGIELGTSDVQNIEKARYAPQNAIAELAINQGNARLAGQNAELNQYNVEAAGLIKQAMTPVGPSQDYSAIYSKTSSLKQKQDLAKQKLAKAEQLRNATMASGKFSESTRQAYEDAQAESKAVDTEFKTFQEESLRKVLDPALTARDQSSWDMAKPQLAEATAEAAVQEAVKSGVPEENLARLRNDVRNQTLASLPKAWGASAQNFVRSKGAELKSLEASNKMDEQVRKEEEHKMKMKEYQSKIAENYAQRDKALNEARGGNPAKLTEEHGKWVTQANTAFDNLGKAASKVTELEGQIKIHKDNIEEYSNTPTTEEAAESTRLATELTTAQANKTTMQKDLDYANQQKTLTEELIKAKGLSVPKPEPRPDPKKQIENSAIRSWGSYEPDKYDYRVSSDGKLQRKAR